MFKFPVQSYPKPYIFRERPGSIAQSVALLKIDHEIISTPFHLFTKGSCQLLAKVSAQSTAWSTLRGLSASRLTDRFYMILTALPGP